MKLLLMVPRTSSMHFLTLLFRDMAKTGANLLLLFAWMEPPKFLIQIKASGYIVALCQAWNGYF